MYYRTTLSNGIRVIGEHIPHFRSVSIGIWIGAGSCTESPEINGISHFLEHMFFKGTNNRTAAQIATEIDAVGGQLNAFTAKECTCLYAKVMDEHLPIAVNVLSDMLLNSKFAQEEIDKEKGVVSEEILMSEDSPEDLVHDLLSKAYFQSHPLGKSILGTNQSLMSLTRDSMISYVDQMYNPSNIVIAIAGRFEEQALVELLEKALQPIASRKDKAAVKTCEVAHIPARNHLFADKDIEQMNLCIGFPGINQQSDDITGLLIFNNLFGGAMSSRLFQRLREQRGLVYTVYSYPSSYIRQGLFTIYAATNPNNAKQAVELILAETDDVMKTLSKVEFENAREQLKGNYFLGLESTSSRMNAMGKGELLLDRVYTSDEVVERIHKVTMDDIHRIMAQIFRKDVMCSASVGRVKKSGLENLFD